MPTSRLYPSDPIHGRVAHDIGRKIVSGAIPQGANLPRESELSEQFSVSRQAIREALKVLAAKGLIVSRRRAGTKVTPRAVWNLLDPDVVAWHPAGEMQAGFHRDLFELRRLIEPAAAALAAQRADESAIERIGASIEAMRGLVGDTERFQKAIVEFHMSVFAASGNDLIERLNIILGPLLAASFRSLPAPFPLEDFENAVAAIEPVYAAIRSRDAEAARAAMESQLLHASEYVENLVTRSAGPSPKEPLRKAGEAAKAN